MASISNLASLLLRDQEVSPENNIAYALGTNLLRPIDATQYQRVEPWEQVLGQVLQGAVGGALRGYGLRQAEDETAQRTQGIAQLLSNPNADREAIYSDYPEARKYGALVDLLKAEEDRALSDYFAKEQFKQLANRQFANPIKIKEGADGGEVREVFVNPYTGERTFEGSSYAQFKPDGGGGIGVFDRDNITDEEQIKSRMSDLRNLSIYKDTPESELRQKAMNTDDYRLAIQIGNQARIGEQSAISNEFRQRPPDKLADAVAQFTSGKKNLDKIQGLVAEADDSIVARNLKQIWPQSDEGFLKRKLDNYAVVARNLYEVGVATDQDINRWQSLLSFSKLDTPVSVARRLADFADDAQGKIDSQLQAYKAKGYNTRNLEDLVYGRQGGSVSSKPEPSSVWTDPSGTRFEIIKDASGKPIGRRPL